MEPAALLVGLREHLAQRAPEPQRAVPGGEHRGAHADHHQQAQLLLVQAHVDVDTVGPQVHVVHHPC